MTVSIRWVLKLARIVSGGQTGADVGSLCGARDAGVATGGWAPKGWLTEKGSKEAVLRSFGLKECQRGRTFAEKMRARTWENVNMCDAVLIVGYRSPGSVLTEKVAEELGKPCLWLIWHKGVPLRDEDLERLEEWWRKHNPETLMVAGNRETRNPGVAAAVRELVRDMVWKFSS